MNQLRPERRLTLKKSANNPATVPTLLMAALSTSSGTEPCCLSIGTRPCWHLQPRNSCVSLATSLNIKNRIRLIILLGLKPSLPSRLAVSPSLPRLLPSLPFPCLPSPSLYPFCVCLLVSVLHSFNCAAQHSLCLFPTHSYRSTPSILFGRIAKPRSFLFVFVEAKCFYCRSFDSELRGMRPGLPPIQRGRLGRKFSN